MEKRNICSARSFAPHLCALLLAAILLSGCGKKTSVAQDDAPAFVPRLDSGTTGTILIAGHYANFEALEAEFDRFNAYYPGIELSYEYLDSYNSNIATAIAGSEAPDIFFTFTWMLDKPECEPLFEAAEDLSAPALGINLSAVRQELMTEHPGGKMLMVPVLSSTYGMLVNQDLFKKHGIEIPQTYDDFKSACKKFIEEGIAVPILGGLSDKASSMYSAFSLPYFYHSVGLIPGSVPLLNSLNPEAGKFLAPLLSMTEDFMSSGIVNQSACKELKNDYDALIMRFFEGDIPIAITSADIVSGTKKRERLSEAFIAQPFTYSFHPVPVPEYGGIFFNSPVIDFSVNRNSRNLALANEFMRFLLSSEELNNLSAIKRLVTVSTDFSFDEVYSAFAVATFVYAERTGLMDNAIKQVRRAVRNVANGTMSPEEAMASYGTLWE